jgi:hypothetical protein
MPSLLVFWLPMSKGLVMAELQTQGISLRYELFGDFIERLPAVTSASAAAAA